MLGLFDYGLWLFGFLLELSVVVFSISRRSFLRYLFLNIYMASAAFTQIAGPILIHKYGFNSHEYFYFYYYSESLLTILLFFVIIHFYLKTFNELQVSRYIRGGAVLLLVATILFSYAVVHQHKNQMTLPTFRVVVELGQNLYFVGVVLTYMLFAAILKLRETRARLVQFVLALGVYFSATAATYALRNLFPPLEPVALKWIFPLFGVWLPAAWAYTMARVSEDARLATAHLLARARA